MSLQLYQVVSNLLALRVRENTLLNNNQLDSFKVKHLYMFGNLLQALNFKKMDGCLIDSSIKFDSIIAYSTYYHREAITHMNKKSFLKVLSSAALAATLFAAPTLSTPAQASSENESNEVRTAESTNAHPLDWLAESPAKISAPAFSFLKHNTSYVSYINTRSTIDLKQAERFLSNIQEKNDNYLIASHRKILGGVQVIVTKDGFIGAFLPRKGVVQNNLISNMYTSMENTVREAAKTLTGKDLGNVSHFSFEQPEASQLTVIKNISMLGTSPTITTDANFKAYQLTAFNLSAFEKLDRRLFKAQETYQLKNTPKFFTINGRAAGTGKGTKWNWRSANDKTANLLPNNLEVLHDGKISAERDRDIEHTRPLANLFEPTFKDIGPKYWAYPAISWAVSEGITAGYKDGSFHPNYTLNEGDFAVMLTRYYKLNPSPNYAGQHRTQPFYDQLARYNVPLAGYQNNVAKTAPLTRGSLAQALAASQGHRGDLRSSVQFLYDNGISAGVTGSKTFEDFRVNNILKRNEISAFFLRMNEKGMTQIK